MPAAGIRAFRGAGTLTATAILIFALAIAIAGELRIRQEIASSFAEQTFVQRGLLVLSQMTKIQLDEENYIRAYVITHDRSYIESFRATGAQLDAAERLLHAILAREGLNRADDALVDYRKAHLDWHQFVANPMLRSNALAPQLDERGKVFIDLQRQDAQFIASRLSAKSDAIGAFTQTEIGRTLLQPVVWLAAFGLAAILFNGYRSRATRQLDEERVITQTLQKAFRSEHTSLPNCTIAGAYGAASRRLAVGGDVFDVYRLTDRIGLILIADVSGKGVDAAVLTAFIKFTIRGIALRRRDPAEVLEEFNTAFPRTAHDPSMFVSMFLAFLDTESLELRYASAGHDAIFVKHRSGVEQLSVTGPVLGVMEEPYSSSLRKMESGDILVLATDGLTEARNPSGEFLEAGGAMQWIAQESTDPARLAAGLIERVRRREGNTLHDDIAVLAIRIERDG